MVAIIVSLISLASQAAHPRVYVIGRKRGADVLRPLSPEHPDDETFEGLLILRPEGRLFFVNAQDVGASRSRHSSRKYQPRVLALDMSRVSDIEYSALQMLIEGERRVTERGVEVWLAALNPGVLRGPERRPRRAAWPRAHAVQRARGDRALPGAECGRGERGLATAAPPAVLFSGDKRCACALRSGRS